MSRVPYDHTDELDSFPRLRGDEPVLKPATNVPMTFSPPTRG